MGGTEQARRVTDRERFLTFALAAAEILLEVTPEGRVLFAAGTLQSRLGTPPETWVGRPVRDLLARADRQGFDLAFAGLLARDRLAPTCFHLADAAGTPMACAGLRLLGQDEQRICVTLAAMPGTPAAPAGGPAALRNVAERVAREGGTGSSLGLIELQGTDGPLSPPPEMAERIRGTIAGTLGPDAVAGELVAGRYGVLSHDNENMAAIGACIASVVGEAATVATRSLPLETEGLTPLQASRALRHALDCFTHDGAAALDRAGFTDGLSGFVREAYARALWLRRAIADRRFRLAFQPIVHLADRAPHHFEALLRPEPDPEAPVSGVQEFVTFAETAGLSEELDWAVLGTVCAAARQARSVRIAANLSGLTLQSPAFRERLLALLDAEPLLCHRLLIEITETAEIEDEAEAVRTVEALRARGLPLCIDDFGAGAAAFRYLRTFRVDFVKIDGLYVTAAGRGTQDRDILAGMVDLARTVGARVVAERIETEEEAALMHSLGVEFGQGWLFGRPGPLPGAD
ncbi:EAL domain-containing protein [Roseicella aquatilis]|uniref:EAL domain-containing protein n=1 Tax=Roseicella aquatilis TaxID=2527868 RepID=A0A4R4D7T1_9PROT|nr:EAL domain-containing protein [Roseicella aquatilis]TCZ56321.1 EAL domain-containing protein [Roseicella aquatilis]